VISPADEVVARGRRIVLRRKKLADAADEFRWRQDNELARYDAAPPMRLPFPQFFRQWSLDQRFADTGRRSFAIEDEAGRHIGNTMYYNVDLGRREAEIGISIGDKGRWGHRYGSDAVVTLARYIFRQTDLQRLYLHTLDWNLRAQRSFRRAGFQMCGTAWRNGQTFLLMDLWREQVAAGSATPAATR
jgi:RimJ/RimL family protein N-acetyltransferase